MLTPNWLRSFRGVLISTGPGALKSKHRGAAGPARVADGFRRRLRAEVLLVDCEQDAAAISRIRQFAEHGESVILCFGNPGDGWREEALSAGALACFPGDTPLAGQICLPRVAVRHVNLLAELGLIRDESNRIRQILLECLGGANESPGHARGEAQQVRDDLERVRQRILRAFV